MKKYPALVAINQDSGTPSKWTTSSETIRTLLANGQHRAYRVDLAVYPSSSSFTFTRLTLDNIGTSPKKYLFSCDEKSFKELPTALKISDETLQTMRSKRTQRN